MCEVTKDNFQQLLPEVFGHIDRAAFVAFDCEFTSLSPDSDTKNSLFDTIQQRYRKLAHPPLDSVISQFGLAIFEQDMPSNTYFARTYNFYICPRSFASVDDRFVCQASSLEFLIRYNFDFNKFLYRGISYLNTEQEKVLKSDLSGGALLRPIDRNIPFQDEDKIREICGDLAVWISKSKVGDEMVVDSGLVVPYVLHLEIRRKFVCLWSFSSGEVFTVKMVTPEERKKFEEDESEKELAEQLLESMIGFTKVIRHISQARKPIVGHNCLLDLLKIYKQFHSPLPSQYTEFKREINKLFPIIFDTKHICYNMKRKIGRIHPELESIFSSSNLNLLHKVLVERDDKYNVMWSPQVIHAENFKQYEGFSNPHEAGYDAFIAGFCFVRIGHLAATINYLDIKKMRVLGFNEKLEILSEYSNCINIGRAVTNHVNLGGEEPVTDRPTWLHVRARKGRLDCMVVAEKFARFACSDIRQMNRAEAVVAISTHRGAREVMVAFSGGEDWVVERYSMVRHNRGVRRLLWGGVVLGVSLGIGLVWKEIQR